MKFIDTILFKTLKLPAADVCVKGQPKEKKKNQNNWVQHILKDVTLSKKRHQLFWDASTQDIQKSNSRSKKINLYLEKAVYFSRKHWLKYWRYSTMVRCKTYLTLPGLNSRLCAIKTKKPTKALLKEKKSALSVRRLALEIWDLLLPWKKW